VTCPAGTDNAAGDDASAGDSACDAIICAVDEHVVSNACVVCLAGTENLAGDDASSQDTTCDVTLCAINEYVDANVCTPCQAGTVNVAGDDASASADTTCDPVACSTDERVVNNACVACPAGSENVAGDDSSGSNTNCDAITCATNEFVLSNACTACADGTERPSGDDATGGNTECAATTCDVNEYVLNKVCTACPAGTTNAAGDDASGTDDTTCDTTLCAINEYVATNVCTACGTGTENAIGDPASGVDTVCTAVHADLADGALLLDATRSCASNCATGWAIHAVSNSITVDLLANPHRFKTQACFCDAQCYDHQDCCTDAGLQCGHSAPPAPPPGVTTTHTHTSHTHTTTTTTTIGSELPVCSQVGTTVHALCGSILVKVWGVGSEGATQAVKNCNFAAQTQKQFGYCDDVPAATTSHTHTFVRDAHHSGHDGTWAHTGDQDPSWKARKACQPSAGATCNSDAACDGLACDDGNAGTHTDRCSSGTCAGTDDRHRRRRAQNHPRNKRARSTP